MMCIRLLGVHLACCVSKYLKSYGHPGPCPKVWPIPPSLVFDCIRSLHAKDMEYLQPYFCSHISSNWFWPAHPSAESPLLCHVLRNYEVHTNFIFFQQDSSVEDNLCRSLFSYRSNPILHIVPVLDSNILRLSPLRCHHVQEEIVLSTERLLHLGWILFSSLISNGSYSSLTVPVNNSDILSHTLLFSYCRFVVSSAPAPIV